MSEMKTAGAGSAAQKTGEQSRADKTREELKEENQEIRKELKKNEKLVKAYQYFLLRLVLLLLVLWVLFFKIVGVTRMPNTDMYPRLDGGDFLLYYRLDTDVQVQDVIVLEKTPPDSAEEQLFVLRVVAKAGDTVDISEEGRLCVNGNALIESNIFYTNTLPYEGYLEFPITLGDDECFVLADARDGGADSRYFGPVKQDEIRGTVISIFRRMNL